MTKSSHTLTLKRLGIDTQEEFIVFMREDCEVCRSEGFRSLTRVEVRCRGKSLIATLNVIRSALLDGHEASLSESAWNNIGAVEGDTIELKHVSPVESFHFVREKLLGHKLTPAKYRAIITDIAGRKYSTSHIAAFISACAGPAMTTEEIIGLTKAMVDVGRKIEWRKPVIVDKHCIGGLPGNRTTPIVTAIMAALGFAMPKTSSRAITSPAGTADTMETMTNVDLNYEDMRRVVESENGCLVWGGAVDFSPADDLIVRVERLLTIDSEGQMIASILSKKLAAGATHVVIDIPAGPFVKVKDADAAEMLAHRFQLVGMALGLKIGVLVTDGLEPVGRGIGPALEARDILSVLRGESHQPLDLKNRALALTGALLELSGGAECGQGIKLAEGILESGEAYRKFQAICVAQGRFTEPGLAPYRQDIFAQTKGLVVAINCEKIARIAKLSGAPQDPLAGVLMAKRIGDHVSVGEPLYTIFAQSPGELNYALGYVNGYNDAFTIGGEG